MGFYNLSPALMRRYNPNDAGELLTREGSNLANVLAQLNLRQPELKDRIEEYLARVVPGLVEIEASPVGNTGASLVIRKQMKGSSHPWRFSAVNMSDGTLRALGILVALFQAIDENGSKIPLVGIEEPELALHPAASGILRDAIREASRKTQVLVTSHSPDLLDDRSISTETILAVLADDGLTKIGGIDEVGASVLRDRLYTPGELLRLNELFPEPRSSRAEAVDLFGRTSAPVSSRPGFWRPRSRSAVAAD
jgi:predicted ATPase